jgi:adenylate cyclase
MIREWLFIIVSITSLMYLYYFITWWGLKPYLGDHVYNSYFDSGYAMFEIFIQGISFGILFGLINFLVDHTSIRKKSFGAVILIKTVLYTLAVAFSQLLVIVIYKVFDLVPDQLLQDMQEQIYPSVMITMSIYFILVILLINFLLQINRKFGYTELLSMITGKYHKPRKERRIFMFLDMKDSTGNAERLGHVDYSRLIQSCLHDLTDLIMRYKAQVYQYVGDEVVLTWPTKSGMQHLNFINLFYAFEQRLDDKKEYYLKRYGMIPEFKAGVDEGIITATEVGDIKREIAYHGDVLHTAARLEKMCNRLDKNLLVTQKVNANLTSLNGYDKEDLGEYLLRGKEREEKIFGISRIG